jgi:hypothetical protein
MFTLVICQIFLAGVPTYIIHFLCNLITNPKESHFHRTRSLPLDSIIRNTDGRSIIAVDRRFRLWVPHVAKNISEDNGQLTVVVEGTKFGFSS